MNGHYETNGIYPLSISPACGWGHPNPTDERIIQHVNGKAIMVVEDGYELVKIAEATRFPDEIEATATATALIKQAQAKLTRITTPEVEGAAV